MVHLLFEQSGTFRDAFRNMGIDAMDYDICNDYGKTDVVVDIFKEIEKAYDINPSIFDGMHPDDLCMAFFPCIYFQNTQMMYYAMCSKNLQHLTRLESIPIVIDRIAKREYYYTLLYKLLYVAELKRIRLVIENPATNPSYLMFVQNFIKPSVIDYNRMLRGDYYEKPTAYWFINCEPTHGCSVQLDKPKKQIAKTKRSRVAGKCSKDRSLISPDYARNWINDFLFGRTCDQDPQQLSLFGQSFSMAGDGDKKSKGSDTNNRTSDPNEKKVNDENRND